MKRCVEPERLDTLPVADPDAVGSRRDLGRLNAWMGNDRTMARTLRAALDAQPPWRIMELGAGDGTFLLRVARRLAPQKQGTTVVLLDQQDIIAPETRAGFERLGWRVELLKMEVLDWLRRPDSTLCDAMVANLFLHHFSEVQLAELLRGAARRARAFIAVEPRRSAWSLAVSRQLWLIGCNRVTRHDAPVSVQAGFTGSELSRLWPANETWSLEERPQGWLSHLFVAQRILHSASLLPPPKRSNKPI